jgi:hypothetical protein
MKKLILFFFVLTFQIFAQGIYFSVPTSSSVFQSSGGQAAIPYNFYHANGIVVYNYYARLTYPDGTQSNWMIGETGGWWVTKAGTYYIEGKAWVQSIFGGSAYWAYRNPFSFSVVDNDAPTAPQNLSVSQSSNNHPRLSWTANNQADLSHYEIWKKGGEEGGDWHLKSTTSNTYFEDYDETVVTGPAVAFEGKAYYRIKAIDINSNISPFSNQVEIRIRLEPLSKSWSNSMDGGIITEYLLLQNYPNPFNPSTTINYQIKEKGFVTLKVYDMLGKEVANLVNEVKPEGIFEVKFDASKLPSGVYIYSIRVNDFVQNQKMILLK